MEDNSIRVLLSPHYTAFGKLLENKKEIPTKLDPKILSSANNTIKCLANLLELSREKKEK